MDKNLSGENIVAEPTDYECSICLNLMCEPCKTECNHYFCLMCIQSFSEYKKNCPFCRREFGYFFVPKIDKEKQKEILEKHPEAYNARVEEVKAIRLKEAQKIKLTIIYGNDHEIVDVPGSSNSHSWTAFVRLADQEDDIRKYIKKVVFKLHPTFRNPIRECKNPPFEVSCLGWGVFLIPIVIHWQPWLEMGPTEVEHFLSFQGNGKMKSHSVKYDPELLEKLKKDQ